MKTKRIPLLVIILILLLTPLCAYSASQVNAGIDSVSGSLVVDVKSDNIIKTLSLIIYPVETLTEATPDAADIAEQKVYMNSFNLNSNSLFFQTETPKTSGLYRVVINANEIDKALTTNFVNLSQTDEENFLSIVNKENNSSEIIKYINDNKNLYFSLLKYYFDISDDDKEAIIISMNKELKYASFNSFCNKLEKQSAVILLGCINNKADFIKYFNQKKDILLKNEDKFSDYFSKCTQDEKNFVYDKIFGLKIFGEKIWTDKLNEARLLSKIKFSSNYSVVKPIIDEAAKLFELDCGKYFLLSNSKNVDTQISGKEFTSLLSLADSVKKLSGEKINTTGGGSSGGGGKSSGSTTKSNINIEIYGTAVNDDKSSSQSVNPFTDLSENHWCCNNIIRLYNYGIVNGDPNGNFRPDDYITRAEFVKLVLSALKINVNDINNNSKKFIDVNKSDWYYNYVYKALECKIVNGVDANYFAPQMNIKRQDMACLIFNALNYNQTALKSLRNDVFKDEGCVDDYALMSVKKLHSAGIINGNENNDFVPQGMLTRAEAVQVIYNLIREVSK